MTEPNSSLQWQARQQWPQIEAWEVPPGHLEKLPQLGGGAALTQAAQGMLELLPLGL